MVESLLYGFTGVIGSGNAMSLVSFLGFIVVIGFILRFFSQDDIVFSDNFVLTFLLVSFVFLAAASGFEWFANTLSLMPEYSGTTVYTENLLMASETLKIPGYSFFLATAILFYRRMSRL